MLKVTTDSKNSTLGTQLTFTCLNSTTETLEKGVKYVLKVNNKNTRMTSLTSFWCIYC